MYVCMCIYTLVKINQIQKIPRRDFLPQNVLDAPNVETELL